MTEDRKIPDQQNQSSQTNQNQANQPRRGEVPDPLKQGMRAAGGHVLHGMGMSASAQQSGRGLGESSLGRNWDAGGEPGQDDRGTISTGPDTAPDERARQRQFHQEQEQKQQQQNLGGARSDLANQAGANPPRQPSLDETTPPDVLARNPDVTK
ncbi:hypothetical protein [Pedomonas mirosovicensis]|uniref:hypothetical protein n=1 Tax=Pedomonas mirosovicensis TaxID=2908641 RepID=UPI00216805C2|nr:hypothetical protein [Pedomonas mirosovicensis]MCH8686113.1 hypothetical protein [Pedomonas mirosovicensis]